MKLSLFMLIVQAYASVIKKHVNESLHFKGEISEVLTIQQLNNSIDTILIHHGVMDGLQNQGPCSVVQRQYQFYPELNSNQFELIQWEELIRFDSSKPLNIRTLISMALIRDGMIALSSDSVLYMLKFGSEFSGSDFAKLIWKAEIGQYMLKNDSVEIPQLIYSPVHNQALLIYYDYTLFLNISSMEDNQEQVRISIVNGFSTSINRYWTIQFNDYLISACDGLEVYRIKGDMSNVVLAKQYKANDLFEDHDEESGFVFYDVSIYQSDDKSQSYLFAMEKTKGICIFEIIVDDTGLKFKEYMRSIGEVGGGYLVEHYQGTIVVGVYERYNQFQAIEYQLDLVNKKWIVVRKQSLRDKIVDIGITKDLVVLQGIEQLEHFIPSLHQNFTSYSNQDNFVYYPGVRQLTFLNPSLFTKQLEDQVIEDITYNGMDIIVGIMSQSVFMARYRLQQSYIKCFTSDLEYDGKQLDYTLVYNASVCLPEVPSAALNQVCQISQDFTLLLVTPLINDDNIGLIVGLAIGLFVFFLLLIGFTYWRFRQYQQKENNLNSLINGFSEKKFHPADNYEISKLPQNFPSSQQVMIDDQSQFALK